MLLLLLPPVLFPILGRRPGRLLVAVGEGVAEEPVLVQQLQRRPVLRGAAHGLGRHGRIDMTGRLSSCSSLLPPPLDLVFLWIGELSALLPLSFVGLQPQPQLAGHFT